MSSVHSYNTSSSASENFHIKASRLEIQENAFSRMGVKLWNEIPSFPRELPKKSFKLRIKIKPLSVLTNFSCLTDNGKCNCLKMFEKSSEHLRNSLIILKIGWKSFGNRWPCFEVSVFFGSRRKIFGNLWKSSKMFSDLRKSSENFGNLRNKSVNLRKIRFCRDEKSHAFY